MEDVCKQKTPDSDKLEPGSKHFPTRHGLKHVTTVQNTSYYYAFIITIIIIVIIIILILLLNY